MKFTLRPKLSLRSLAVLGLSSLVLSLGACGGPVGGGGAGGGDQQQEGQQGGSATSGTVNWWGWTPTDTATANGYIAAFNKEYPDIKVNFKLVSIPDWRRHWRRPCGRIAVPTSSTCSQGATSRGTGPSPRT